MAGIDYKDELQKLNDALAQMIDNGELDEHEGDEIAITVIGDERDEDDDFILEGLEIGEQSGGTWVHGNEFSKVEKRFLMDEKGLEQVIGVHLDFV